MMFHLKPQHLTLERIVHVYSQSLDSGFAVVLPGEVRAVWTSLPWVSSSTKPTSSQHTSATSMALDPPHSPEGLEGWWMKGQGVKPPHSLPTQLSNTSSFQKKCWPKYRPQFLQIRRFRHVRLENKCFTTICFLRDKLCIHQGAVWPFVTKASIFHFSFFPLLHSFFPGFISGDSLWRYG